MEIQISNLESRFLCKWISYMHKTFFVIKFEEQPHLKKHNIDNIITQSLVKDSTIQTRDCRLYGDNFIVVSKRVIKVQKLQYMSISKCKWENRVIAVSPTDTLTMPTNHSIISLPFLGAK